MGIRRTVLHGLSPGFLPGNHVLYALRQHPVRQRPCSDARVVMHDDLVSTYYPNSRTAKSTYIRIAQEEGRGIIHAGRVLGEVAASCKTVLVVWK